MIFKVLSLAAYGAYKTLELSALSFLGLFMGLYDCARSPGFFPRQRFMNGVMKILSSPFFMLGGAFHYGIGNHVHRSESWPDRVNVKKPLSRDEIRLPDSDELETMQEAFAHLGPQKIFTRSARQQKVQVIHTRLRPESRPVVFSLKTVFEGREKPVPKNLALTMYSHGAGTCSYILSDGKRKSGHTIYDLGYSPQRLAKSLTRDLMTLAPP